MEVTRIHLKGWTASFRYPMFITGYQPTITVPPLSTIYGLLSAAVGKAITPYDTKVAYVFNYKGKGTDLETIYEIAPRLKAKPNVIKREFLYEPELFLYVENQAIANGFFKPFYPLVLGRSSDLLEVKEIKEINLQKAKAKVKFGNTIIPFIRGIQGSIQALPTYFTEDMPRKAMDTKVFLIVDTMEETDCQEIQWEDNELNWGLFFHGAD